MEATGAREVVSQKLEFGNSEYTLGEAIGETLETEMLKNLTELQYMSV